MAEFSYCDPDKRHEFMLVAYECLISSKVTGVMLAMMKLSFGLRYAPPCNTLIVHIIVDETPMRSIACCERLAILVHSGTEGEC